jgi:hypothetical protein
MNLEMEQTDFNHSRRKRFVYHNTRARSVSSSNYEECRFLYFPEENHGIKTSECLASRIFKWLKENL